MTTGTCATEATECELQYAISQAADGSVDQILLDAGTYTDGTDGFELDKEVTMRGDAGERPLLKATGSGENALENSGDGAVLEHIAFESADAETLTSGFPITVRDADIKSSGTCANLLDATVADVTAQTSAAAQTCLFLRGIGSVSRVVIQASGNDAQGMAFESGFSSSFYTTDDVSITAGGDGVAMPSGTHRRMTVVAGDRGVTHLPFTSGPATLTDSLIRGGTDAIQVANGTLTLRNVTAVGGGRGAVISGENGDTGAGAGTLAATNVIARGASAAPAQDAVIENHNNCGSPCDPGVANFAYSNLRTAAGGGITLGAGIQTSDPLFISPTNLHLQSGSPAIGAGSSSGVDSTLDVDRQARVMGGRIDLGADEFFVAPPGGPARPPAGGGAPAIPVVPPDTSRPRVSRVRLGRSTIVFTTSEAARVRVKVERRTVGRRRGRRCVKRTRRNRRRKHCNRYVRVGTKTFKVKRGRATRSFKFRRKGLKRGRYRLTFTATDAAGNKSTRRVRVRKRR